MRGIHIYCRPCNISLGPYNATPLESSQIPLDDGVPCLDLTALRLAATTVYQSMSPTPQLAWPLLAEQLDCTVWVKHENHTPTGAFKVRGGMLYVQGLLRENPTPAAWSPPPVAIMARAWH